MIVYLGPRFERSFKNLDQPLKSLADRRVAIFRKNPFDSRLKTHPLHGRLKRQWSFSINSRVRVLFEFLDKAQTEVVFLDIGSHALYE